MSSVFIPYTTMKKAARFEFWQSPISKQWFWHIRAGNGEIIANGESYKRKAGVIHVHALICGNRMALVEVNANFKPKHFEGNLKRRFP